MNSSAPHPHRRRLTRAEVRRRRRSRAIRRVAGLTVMLCVAAGGVTFLLTHHAAIPSASAASAISMPAQSIADSTVSSAENTAAAALRANVLTALAKAFPGNDVEIQRLEMVGPKVGNDLTNKALGALYYATLLIAVYISGRFEQRWMAGVAMAAVLWGGMYLAGLTGLSMGWLVLVALGITLVVCFVLKLNFALGALVGLIHDVFITVGLLSLMGVEIDLNVMAALLTLVGYSLNDTIIVYDRLREHLRAAPKQPLDALINRSVNQTLSRTILTSGTTFVATLALYLLGGGVIHDFALTMLIGVFVGTASSIYVSSAVLLALGDTDFYVHQQERPVYEKPGEHGVCIAV